MKRWGAWAAVVVLVVVSATFGSARPVPAREMTASYVPISGAGSTWSQNAIKAWTANVAQYGMVVTYNGVGSTTGRSYFKQGTVDWAASDIPYGVKDGTSEDPVPTSRGFAYMPVTAGGTVFMYNLAIGTTRVTNLRLSGTAIAGIFTGTITKWNDPAITADNPGLTLPALPVIPVVRSDGSGSTAQFTQWMVATQGGAWNAYCAKVGRSPCTQTSAYPLLPGSRMVGQAGDLGVAGYVSQAGAVGTIGYVEYSYTIQSGFPAAKVLNNAGYYTEPTPGHVAVALLKAKINTDKTDLSKYLTQDLSQVYTNPDPRSYPLSSYSYMILPTDANFNFNPNKGNTLGDFGKYVLCQGQTQVNALGYSALPINLVKAGYEQLARIPGANIPATTADQIRSCNNPTFAADGTNTLANTDPYPPACDKRGATQCTTGTGGARNQSTGSGTSSGANPTATLNPSAGPASVCDPSAGLCEQNSGANGNGVQDVAAVPLTTPTVLGNAVGVVLMIVASGLLLVLVVAPPILARASANRRARREEDLS